MVERGDEPPTRGLSEALEQYEQFREGLRVAAERYERLREPRGSSGEIFYPTGRNTENSALALDGSGWKSVDWSTLLEGRELDMRRARV